jgi:hypothetical protein
MFERALNTRGMQGDQANRWTVASTTYKLSRYIPELPLGIFKHGGGLRRSRKIIG